MIKWDNGFVVIPLIKGAFLDSPRWRNALYFYYDFHASAMDEGLVEFLPSKPNLKPLNLFLFGSFQLIIPTHCALLPFRVAV